MNKSLSGSRLFAASLAIAMSAPVFADEPTEPSEQDNTWVIAPAPQQPQTPMQKFISRLSIGGYGEAVMTRNFYSDDVFRYRTPESSANDDGHGRFDLPHVVINLGYDFTHGWEMGMEIEFEHGGTESAVEMDADEGGEYEAEIEKGGEVALEQFWIQKSFLPQLNLRAGEIVVPIGATNAHHMPTEFFTVYRPEGENTIFPCTWHQVGVSLWGKLDKWKYEAQFLSGLESERFGAESFIHYGSNSIYEFKIANKYAAALRVDNYSVPDLRLSLSAYAGRSFGNSLNGSKLAKNSKYDGVTGSVKILAFDFALSKRLLIVRGNVDWAWLEDSKVIGSFNTNMATHSKQDGSPSKRQPVGSQAMVAGGECGFDFFGLSDRLHEDNRRLILFGRYEHYDSMKKGGNKITYTYVEKDRWAVGLNYFPMKEIVVKAEYSRRTMVSPFNDEPSLSMGIAYSGWFK